MPTVRSPTHQTLTTAVLIHSPIAHSDGSATSGLATVSITVGSTNSAPSVTADVYSTLEDTTLTVAVGQGLLANDFDPDGDPIIAVLVSAPAHGAISLNPDGSFTYTPDPNYNGLDSFTYRASSLGLLSSLGTVSLNITSVNDTPTAVGESYSLVEDGTLNVSAPGLLANDSDADGDSLTAVLVAGPSHGALILNSNGSFSYTPNANYNGSDSFTYRASDGASSSGAVTVSFNISATPDAPVALEESFTLPEDGTLNVSAPGVLANDSDSDGGSITAVLVSGPSTRELGLQS